MQRLYKKGTIFQGERNKTACVQKASFLQEKGDRVRFGRSCRLSSGAKKARWGDFYRTHVDLPENRPIYINVKKHRNGYALSQGSALRQRALKTALLYGGKVIAWFLHVSSFGFGRHKSPLGGISINVREGTRKPPD